jgi:hypothetical protein
MAAGVLAEEVVDQQGDVCTSGSQGWDVDAKDIQPVEEVLPEAPRGDLVLQPAVGRSHDAHVDVDGLPAPDALQLPGLQNPEEPDLGRQGNLADLIEQQCAAVRLLEAAFMSTHRSCECALLVPEQLALQQPLWQRRTVDHHKGPLRPAAAAVDGVADELFARAGRSGDQHEGFGGGDGVDQLVDALHLGGRPDQGLVVVAVLQTGPQALDLHLQPAGVQGTLKHDHQLVPPHGLDEVVGGASAHGRNGVLDRAVAGHDHNGEVGIDGLEAVEQLVSVHSGHLDVGEDEVRTVAGHPLQRLLGG